MPTPLQTPRPLTRCPASLWQFSAVRHMAHVQDGEDRKWPWPGNEGPRLPGPECSWWKTSNNNDNQLTFWVLTMSPALSYALYSFFHLSLKTILWGQGISWQRKLTKIKNTLQRGYGWKNCAQGNTAKRESLERNKGRWAPELFVMWSSSQ